MIKKLTFLLSIVLVTLHAAANPLAIKGDQPIKIDADSLEVMEKEKIAIFSGNVQATQADSVLKSNKMKVYYSSESSAGTESSEQRSISKIDVIGNVNLSSPRENATAEKGIYDVKNNTVTLIGSVVLTKGKNILKGSRLVYNMQTGKSQLSGTPSIEGTNRSGGRVQGIFIPERGSR